MGAAIGDWGGPAPGSRSAPRSPEKDGRAAAGLLQFHKNIHKYISVSLTGSEAAQAPIKHSHCSARRSRLGSRRRKCIKGGCGSSGSSPQNLCFLRRQARGCCWLPEGCAERGAESREQPGAGGTAEMPKGRRGRELAPSPASSFSSSSSSVRAGSTGGERRPPSPARGVPASAPARRGHVSTRGGSTLTPPPQDLGDLQPPISGLLQQERGACTARADTPKPQKGRSGSPHPSTESSFPPADLLSESSSMLRSPLSCLPTTCQGRGEHRHSAVVKEAVRAQTPGQL